MVCFAPDGADIPLAASFVVLFSLFLFSTFLFLISYFFLLFFLCISYIFCFLLRTSYFISFSLLFFLHCFSTLLFYTLTFSSSCWLGFTHMGGNGKTCSLTQDTFWSMAEFSYGRSAFCFLFKIPIFVRVIVFLFFSFCGITITRPRTTTGDLGKILSFLPCFARRETRRR